MRKAALIAGVLTALTGLVVFAKLGDNGGGRRAADGTCGAYALPYGANPAPYLRQQECLVDAFLQGTPQELQVVRRTLEGDPVSYRFRVLGPRRLEVVHDTTRDPYSSQSLETLRCLAVVADGEGVPYYSGCTAA